MSILSFWGKTTNQLCPLLHVISNNSCQVLHRLHGVNGSRMTPPTIYRSLDKVLDVLKNYKADNVQAVNSLLGIYNNALKSYEENQDSGTKKCPLIVLEGLDGSGKSTVGKKLAKKLEARNWCTPPESIKPIRNLFDDHSELRTAYYALGNYIAALEVAVILQQQSVVMDRYWHSTAAFAMAQAIHDFPEEVKLPSVGDPFYHWPEDLLKPNIVLFLDVREDIRRQRISKRLTNTAQEDLLISSENFRNNIISAYKNMIDPKVVFVNGSGSFKSVLAEIDTEIKHLIM